MEHFEVVHAVEHVELVGVGGDGVPHALGVAADEFLEHFAAQGPPDYG